MTLATTPRLIRQAEPKGCGVACLAMLAGLSYDEARAICGPRYRPEAGMTREALDRVLARFQLAVCRQSGISLLSTVHLAEVVHQDQPRRTFHFVVVLGDGTVLDPLRDEPTTLTSYRRVRCVAAIVPVQPMARAC